jgi:hypothetical protein
MIKKIPDKRTKIVELIDGTLSGTSDESRLIKNQTNQ